MMVIARFAGPGWRSKMTIKEIEEEIRRAKYRVEHLGCGWLGKSEKQYAQIDLLESILRFIDGRDIEIKIRH